MSTPASDSRQTRTTFFKDPKRLVATLVTGVVGLIVFIDALGAGAGAASLAFLLVNWAALLVAIALLVGLLSVAGSHFRRVLQRHADWGYSVVLLLSMLIVIFIGIVGVPGVVLLPPNLAEEPIRRFFHAVYEPLTSSLLALLAFFSLSTIIRALQRRSTEVVVIVVVAFVVLVVQLPPIAEQPLVSDVLLWLNQYVALAGARGLLIGVTIGIVVASMRVLLGFDQPYLDN